MKKVTIVGAGNVGGTAAMRIFDAGLAQVAVVDIVGNLARAKAADMEDAQYSLGTDNRIAASDDMGLMAGSDIVVVTAGLPRKPGMTREDLLSKNAAIMTQVCATIKEAASEAIVIIVSNPLDVMTYLAYQKTGLPRHRIFGMGASLDTARFANLISKKLLISPTLVEALVIGSHGETMLPLPRLTKVRGKSLVEVMKAAEVEELVQATKQRGAEIVSLYGSGSAYYAPSAAIFQIVETILKGKPRTIPVCANLEGEFGLHDVAIGVPARIGARGIEKILEVDLNAAEREALAQSAQSIRESIRLVMVRP